MKPLIISTSDIQGGAARSAYRLHQGFKSINVESQMLVQTKYSDDSKVIGASASSGIGNAVSGLKLTLDRLPLKLYSGCSTSYSLPWLPEKIAAKVNQINPDLNIETITQFNKPLIWTFHDMWAFTGGCHYNQECASYTSSCGACPQLHSYKEADLSRWIWHRKAKAWKNLNLTIVTPSRWLASCARASSLFKDRRIEVIPYGLDIQKYRPMNKEFAREILNLPQDKKLILFGSLQATSDKRKGFHLLQPALNELSALGWQEQLELVVFGASKSDKSTTFGFKSHYLGTLNDDLSLALAYSAADVFIAPSVQDNLPNTVMEAIACGTPSVAFDIGGMPDMIEHQRNGYLAQPFKIEDLAKGIAWVLENKQRHQKLSHRAREKTEQEFALEIQAKRYCSVFKSLVMELALSKY
jgi:glycosyltransferase involved in cell wall biosynthesis